MTSGTPFDDERLQDFLDGRMGEVESVAFLSGLSGRPGEARRIVQLMANDDLLKRSLDATLDEPIPERLTEAARRGRVVPLRRRPVSRWVADAVAVAAVLVIGVGIGWFAHNRIGPLQDFSQIAYNEALTAFAVYLDDPGYPVRFDNERIDDMLPHTEVALGRRIAPPDLGLSGFDLVGGEMLLVTGGRAVMYLYKSRNDPADRVSIYMWRRPSESANSLASTIGWYGRDVAPAAARTDILTRSWSEGGIGFTLMTMPGTVEIDDLETTIRSHFAGAQAKSG